MSRLLLDFMVCAVLWSLSTTLFAHALAPSLLELKQIDLQQGLGEKQTKARYSVFWKQPIKQAKGVILTPNIINCSSLSSSLGRVNVDAFEQRWEIECPADPSGIEVFIAGLQNSSTYVLVRIHYLTGEQIFSLLDANNPRYRALKSISNWQSFQHYLFKGAYHFSAGYDHMLFVFGLLVLLRKRIRKLILSLTCFTVGHGISLGFASNGLVSLNGLIVELFILATLIWMALEVLSTNQSSIISVKQHPYLLTSLFGLIHGLGFAGAFLEYSQSYQSTLVQLLAFNLGIEIAQLALILVVLSLYYLIVKLEFIYVSGEGINGMFGYLIGGASFYSLLSLTL
ncbi:MAG: HupE/UreJ family protein [Pseudomonadales bacterium]|nr:HupE/UreJ family protein [Pseudomonadales bacterium]